VRAASITQRSITISSRWTEKKLRDLIKKMGINPRELLRSSESVYRELEIGKKDFSDDEVIRLMIKHPDLIQRPIVERVIARCWAAG
jgi:arsenate reductase